MCELELQFFCLTSSLKQRKHVRRGVTYFRIGVPADDDVNRAWCALAQDRVDIIQSHVVNHRVIDLHDLVPIAEGMKRKVKSHRAHKQTIICSYGYCTESWSIQEVVVAAHSALPSSARCEMDRNQYDCRYVSD